jgi:hypothetical protein
MLVVQEPNAVGIGGPDNLGPLDFAQHVTNPYECIVGTKSVDTYFDGHHVTVDQLSLSPLTRHRPEASLCPIR